jgi:alpha/beta superfamily hydrolase
MTTPPDTKQRLQIAGPAGPLDVLIEPAADPGGPLCVICHPHPQYGGTLDNKVVYTLARAAQELGAAAVRFNFRGVGQSVGAFDHGVGEVDDLLAVVAWARAAYPGRPLHLAGFSFGAAMALRAHVAAGAVSLLLVAPPAGMGYLEQDAAPRLPWQVIHGSRDELIGLAVLQEWLEALSGQTPPLTVIADADHFFHGRLTPLREAARAFWGPLMLPRLDSTGRAK